MKCLKAVKEKQINEKYAENLRIEVRNENATKKGT